MIIDDNEILEFEKFTEFIYSLLIEDQDFEEIVKSCIESYYDLNEAKNNEILMDKLLKIISSVIEVNYKSFSES